MNNQSQMKGLFTCIITILSLSICAQTQTGKASYYASKFEGRPTASGAIYDGQKLTAAHNTLPFGTTIRVTNLNNQKSVVLTVNDRGPFVDNRIVDLSYAGATAIGMINDGIVDVTLEIISEDINLETVTEPSFFHIEVTKMSPPSGYGVQIMSFAQTDNYVSFVEQLQEKYESKNIVLQSKSVNGQKVVGVILHQFSSREDAEKLRLRLDNDYPDCYIIDFSKYH